MTQPWSPEITITTEQAGFLIGHQFPELLPVELEPLGEGFDNSVFSVNKKYVFRFPRRKLAADLLQTEKTLLPGLASRLPLPIPVPVFIGRPDSSFPWLFLGYKKIEGKTPGELSSIEREQSAERLAHFLHELHQFPLEKAKSLGIPYDQLDRLNLAKRKPILLKNLKIIKDLGIHLDDAPIIRFAETCPFGELDNAEVLVHGDLHIRNILVNAKGIVSGIIDWGDTHIGHPALDLSVVYSFLPPNGRSRFYHIYGNVNEKWRRLAQFKAIYTSVLLIRYGYDLKDEALVQSCLLSLKEILKEENERDIRF